MPDLGLLTEVLLDEKLLQGRFTRRHGLKHLRRNVHPGLLDMSHELSHVCDAQMLGFRG